MVFRVMIAPPNADEYPMASRAEIPHLTTHDTVTVPTNTMFIASRLRFKRNPPRRAFWHDSPCGRAFLAILVASDCHTLRLLGAPLPRLFSLTHSFRSSSPHASAGDSPRRSTFLRIASTQGYSWARRESPYRKPGLRG